MYFLIAFASSTLFYLRSCAHPQSAIFNLNSFITLCALFICTCTYVHGLRPSYFDNHRHGLWGIFRKAAVIGERLSPAVSLVCLFMAFHILFLE